MAATIQDKRILKIHQIFRELREDMSRFFNTTDERLIRFSFGETPDTYQFKVKFTTTHKLLKFVVPKDITVQSIEYQQLEKTKNIIEDISQIYVIKHRDYIEQGGELNSQLKALFLWATRSNKNRQDEIFKAETIIIGQEVQDRSMAQDKLYHDVITNVKIGNLLPNDVCLVTFDLLSGNTHSVLCDEAKIDTMRAGRVLIINYKGEYNLLSFHTAKHHLQFTPSQMQRLTDYFNKQNGRHLRPAA